MAQVKFHPKRQATRRALVIGSFLLFPVILNFFSPYLIIESAASGIVNGSFILFGLLFLSSLFLGRLWCGWLCPGAGLQESCFAVNGRPARGGRWDWIKWGIWLPWIGLIAYAAISAGGYRSVQPLYMTENGISVTEPFQYITYYFVVGMIFVIPLTAGRRAFCHYVCWMAPFMILGRKLRNALNTPALRLQADTAACAACGRCTKECPMSLPVQQLVAVGRMEHTECILCGTCVDTCSRHVIRYRFSRGQ